MSASMEFEGANFAVVADGRNAERALAAGAHLERARNGMLRAQHDRARDHGPAIHRRRGGRNGSPEAFHVGGNLGKFGDG